MAAGRPPRPRREDAEALALAALGFLAADEHRLAAFLQLSGTAPADLRERLEDPEFLAACLDHVLADEALLLAFVETAGVPPEAPAAARRRLPGAPVE